MPPDPPDDAPIDPTPGALEIRGTGSGPLDDPVVVRARGGGPGERLIWRARIRDDDGRVWRATGTHPDELAGAWKPAKAATGPWAALQSLRAVELEIRVESGDGRGATRTITRHLVGDGVRIRRWRDMPGTTLHLPAGDAPCATVLVDATDGPRSAAVAALAAPLLASRGALVLVIAPGRGKVAPDALLATAVERLAAVPTAAETPATVVIGVRDPDAPDGDGDGDGAREPAIVLPPGVPTPADDDGVAAAARATAWDALLAQLGARPRLQK